MEKEYICECGKKFYKPQSFNGHKSNCVVHLEKTGKLEARKQSRSIGAKKAAIVTSKYALEKRNEALAAWIAEQHTCERCGKVMTEKYGSGRFCSKSCANAKSHTLETRAKISTGVANYNIRVLEDPTINVHANYPISRHRKCKADYEACPRLCEICNSPITYERRDSRTCSDACYRLLLSKLLKQRVIESGGNLNPKGPGASKYGTYKGFHCDSSWELAFVIYHLDHNITFQRNLESFAYLYKDIEHKYYPDFIVDDKYIEIKNYDSARNQAKREQFPKDKTLITLFRKAMQPYLDYCVDTYGVDFYTLYDSDKPSWMNKKMEV